MTLRFDREFDPRYGEAVEVAPGVRRVTANNPGPFTFRGTNTFLIGTDAVVVLDPGPDDPVHIDVLVRAIGPAEVTHVLASHSHGDHVGGARLLQQCTGAAILAGARRPAAARAEAPPSETASDFAPDQVLRDGDVVEGAGHRLEAVATPGHASDHLAFALSDRGILFSGDHVMGWSTSVVAPPDGCMGDYLASLDRLLHRPETLYLPAHGDIITDAHAYVRVLGGHRKMREREILARLAHGDRTIPAIVAHIYRNLAPSLAGAASLSTLAHLQHLAARGVVASDGAAALDSTYSLSDAAAAATGDAAPGIG